MKKQIIILICTAAVFSLLHATAFPFSEAQLKTAAVSETEVITDIEQIRGMLTEYVAANQLDARIVSSKEYSGYQDIVVEYNMDASVNAWRQILQYITEQNIDRTNIGVVGIQNGVPMTTANPNADSHTTTTTAKENEKISNPDTIREMFAKFIADNQLNAKVADHADYSGYMQKVIIEFVVEEGRDAVNLILLDFAEAYHFDHTVFTFVPIVNGAPMKTTHPIVSLNTPGDANCDNDVDVSDAVLVARFVAEDSGAELSAQGKINADFNADGEITSDDVILILQKIAKMI